MDLYLSKKANQSFSTDSVCIRLYLIFFSLLLLIFVVCIPRAQATLSLPDPNSESYLTDLSGKLSATYLKSMAHRLENYPFEVRAVFLPQTQSTNLAFYAEKLFHHWKMPEDSMLLAVALDRRKIGVYMGKALKAELKKSAASEITLPAPSSQPSKTSEKNQQQDHLELLPEVIEDMAKALKPKKQPENRPSLAPLETAPKAENLLQSNAEGGTHLESTAKTSKQNLTPLLILAGFLALAAGLTWAFRFWQRKKENQDLISKFSLEGQASFNQLETIYTRMDNLFPNFHSYQGETHDKIKLFLKEVTQTQNRYDEIFDDFENEVQQLGHSDHQSEAIHFFKNLDTELAKGQALCEQAQIVLKNLKELKQTNLSQLTALQAQKQSFSQELHELRKLHPHLKLIRLSPIFQKQHEQLKQMEQENSRDPMRVEKQLQAWQKEMRKLQRELQALPHLWLQFNQDLRTRIENLQKQAQLKPLSAPQSRQLQEVQQLHKNMLQSIEQGDLERINQLNEVFTHKLQSLEAEI
jgi:hypothetical protein